MAPDFSGSVDDRDNGGLHCGIAAASRHRGLSGIQYGEQLGDPGQDRRIVESDEQRAVLPVLRKHMGQSRHPAPGVNSGALDQQHQVQIMRAVQRDELCRQPATQALDMSARAGDTKDTNSPQGDDDRHALCGRLLRASVQPFHENRGGKVGQPDAQRQEIIVYVASLPETG